MAQILGGLAGGLAVIGWVAARRCGPPPCTGGVFVEFVPPLTLPGSYEFELALDDREPCTFVVLLPPDRPVDTSACGLELELSTQTDAGKTRIVGLTLGASPGRLILRVRHGRQSAFDTVVHPEYSEYLAPRAEGRTFCGRRATVVPACVRGTKQCQPFPASCDGPEDCPPRQVCCASPDWAKERGARDATRCLSERRCLDRCADVVCHLARDCPAGMVCDEGAIRGEFEPELSVCRPHARP
ncbi:MAG: hypothetical protein JW751_20965 [Polyangiaceae bacterium]|nr:hypothetical protein [Polyangiaceae bacterium]